MTKERDLSVVTPSFFTSWETLFLRVPLFYFIRKIMKIFEMLVFLNEHHKPSGQRYFPKRFVVRIAVGVWCCSCFFFVLIYCCNLTSHLMSPNQKPIINSFYEIADNSKLSLALDKGYGVEKILQVVLVF